MMLIMMMITTMMSMLFDVMMTAIFLWLSLLRLREQRQAEEHMQRNACDMGYEGEAKSNEKKKRRLSNETDNGLMHGDVP